jgi:transposase
VSIRKGHKKSIVALAHKMLRIVFATLKNNKPYHDQAVDYAALSM